MSNSELKVYIDQEFRKVLEPCKEDYHKLMEKVLIFRAKILSFLEQ